MKPHGYNKYGLGLCGSGHGVHLQDQCQGQGLDLLSKGRKIWPSDQRQGQGLNTTGNKLVIITAINKIRCASGKLDGSPAAVTGPHAETVI